MKRSTLLNAGILVLLGYMAVVGTALYNEMLRTREDVGQMKVRFENLDVMQETVTRLETRIGTVEVSVAEIRAHR